jgi:hypothetical protein
MMRTALVVPFLWLAVFALSGALEPGVAQASGRPQIVKGSKSVQTTPRLPHLSPPKGDAGLIRIAGNLNRKYQYATYFCCAGLEISQSNGTAVAVGFTPSINALVTQVRVAVGFFGQGVNEMVVSLNSDSNGQPGNPIKSWHLKNLPPFGSCCALDIAWDKAGIPVTAATPYWVVVSTDTADQGFLGSWEYNTTDMLGGGPIGYFDGATWNVGNGSQTAFSVLGTKAAD